ncbi:MAG: hypothetical protein R3195_20820 [Gemmatimonadota bacterium]|nr:hypothetical protein [Gemmatimonadota bacterium]
MRSRADELRRQHRKALAWALAAAAALHVVIFLFLPGLRNDSEWSADPELLGVNARGGTLVDVRFGPPLITIAGGAVWQEPPERVLQVVRMMRLPASCDALRGTPNIDGSVRIRVDPAGYAKRVETAESTGHPCADQVIEELAGDLQYHWLPSERFPAPVFLVQPVTLVETVEQ